MSIIEQATKRLEELKRAGVRVPVFDPADGGGPAARAGKPPVVALKTRELPQLDAGESSSAEADSPSGRAPRSVEIDLAMLARQGYLTPDPVNRALADDFRVIKMQLIKSAQAAAESGAKRSNLILVTSSLPAEGKTFTSVNLAMSLAMEVDRSVLLVDADVLRPAVMNRLGVHSDLGLLDLVTRPDLDMADVMLRTNLPKLSLIAAGKQSQRSSEIFASAGMDRFLTELSERNPNRIVVFDAPPLLVSTEARQLASRVGHVLVVVEANRTDSNTVARAFASLESCPLVSSVLNRCPSMSSGAGYGYYYGS